MFMRDDLVTKADFRDFEAGLKRNWIRSLEKTEKNLVEAKETAGLKYRRRTV
jgi:hypothetical protein